MFTIKVEISSESSKAGTILTSDIKANVAEEDFEVSLGKILYSVEEMGYPFVTDEVYQSAIETYKNSVMGAKYVTIFSNDFLKVSMRRTA